MEQRKEIPDTDGKYTISDSGVIKNSKGLIMKQARTREGFMRVVLNASYMAKAITVHRTVATIFVPNPNNFKEVGHKNEDRLDNRAENLFWGENLVYVKIQTERINTLKSSDNKGIIPSNCGKYSILVDEEDYHRVVEFAPNGWEARFFTGSNYPYAITRKTVYGKRMQFFMHRFILNEHDPKVHIDHRNRVGLDNQKRNLRASTSSENMKNRKSAKGSTSSFLGVHFSKEHDRWRAVIKPSERKNIHLGFYPNQLEAAYAYNLAAKVIHKEFANLNKIEGLAINDTSIIEDKVKSFLLKSGQE